MACSLAILNVFPSHPNTFCFPTLFVILPLHPSCRELQSVDDCPFFDLCIVNADAAAAYRELRAFVLRMYPWLRHSSVVAPASQGPVWPPT